MPEIYIAVIGVIVGLLKVDFTSMTNAEITTYGVYAFYVVFVLIYIIFIVARSGSVLAISSTQFNIMHKLVFCEIYAGIGYIILLIIDADWQGASIYSSFFLSLLVLYIVLITVFMGEIDKYRKRKDKARAKAKDKDKDGD